MESEQTEDWKHTKDALANFRRLLLCSKCSSLMKDPVCLGMCEHMLCRSCAAPCAGDGCVVCHSPAWVKDIQINRQLNSIIQLYCDLESMLNPVEQESIADIQTEPKSPVFTQKKNFKICFSPRSRKLRCIVEKPLDVTETSGEMAASQPGPIAGQGQDLSVFNFSSSSQDSGSSSPQKCNSKNKNRKNRSAKNKDSHKVQGAITITRNQSKQDIKKKRLEAINQQWGFTEEMDANLQKDQCQKDQSAQMANRSSKRVSFVSPAVLSDKPKAEVTQGIINENSTVSTHNSPKDSNAEGSITEMNNKDSPGQTMSVSVLQKNSPAANEPNPTNNPANQLNVSSPKPSLKRPRLEDQVLAIETTPKRPRTSPGRRRKSLNKISPGVLRFASVTSPSSNRGTKTSTSEQADSPSVLSTRGRKSPCAYTASMGRPSPGSPAVMKRNHKGETLLHVASIKGDVEAVKELLDQGGDPNLKDNAGWTPLHEACNLGHLEVVEMLLSRGALLNTPGYENDSPLHDAVRNGHVAVVKVLLQHGASQNVLNLHGKRPADYAVSVEMLDIFQKASEANQHLNTSLSPSARLPMVSDSVRGDEMGVFLPSKLSHTEHRNLVKLGQLLGWRMADTCSGSVSHVVVPEGHMPTTYSALMGLLAGCWIVKYSWVEACLQAGERMPETEHEAGEGPQRSRINRCSLLPPLFDGCFFFLLGSFNAPTKDELTKLLREGGGQLLSRQPKPDSDVTQTLSAAAYHALPGSDQALCTQYIIFDPQGSHKPKVVRRGKVWSAPYTWVIDCIAAFQLLPVPEPQISV